MGIQKCKSDVLFYLFSIKWVSIDIFGVMFGAMFWLMFWPMFGALFEAILEKSLG